MGKIATSRGEIEKIVQLRKTGHSMSEIRRIVSRGKATIFKYMKNVEVLPQYKNELKAKQGGSKYRAKLMWDKAKKEASMLMPDLALKSKMLILSCLYWGEGSKKELSLINGDPGLITVFVECLYAIGVKKSDLAVTLRVFEDMDKRACIRYWSKVLILEEKDINNVNILVGKKSGKLKYGMCRVRVKKSQQYFKLIISMIDLLRINFNAAVVQWIERGTPKP